MSWIQVYTGKVFDPINPNISDIDIIDIAWALSHQCRYSGHTKRFYSVAEHSVLISRSVPQEAALWGLLHDASEAYLSDIPRPIKPFLPQYKQWEDMLMGLIAIAFDLPAQMPKVVKEHDHRILKNEQLALMNPCDRDWDLNCEPLPNIQIVGVPPGVANVMFLKRFRALTEVESRRCDD